MVEKKVKRNSHGIEHCNIYDILLCKISKNKHHLLQDARILPCGHSFCYQCLLYEHRTRSTIVCTICTKKLQVENIKTLLRNKFVYQTLNSFESVYDKALVNFESLTKSMSNFSMSEFSGFLSFLDYELEIRHESLIASIDNIHTNLNKCIDKKQNGLIQLNRKLEYLQKTVKYENNLLNDINNCRSYEIKTQYLRRSIVNNIKNLESFSIKTVLLNNRHIGWILYSLNFNLSQFKRSTFDVYELSNQMYSISSICKLDENYLIATNPAKNSLVLLNNELQVTHTVTSIANVYSFDYPIALCTNSNDAIYVCDYYNSRVLVINTELNTVKNVIQTTYYPSDVYHDSNYLYVLNSEFKVLCKYNNYGNILLFKFNLRNIESPQHAAIDPIRVYVYNAKVIVLYSDKRVCIRELDEETFNENLHETFANQIQIEKNYDITGICFSSPYLITTHSNGDCCVYDIINSYIDKNINIQNEFKILHEIKFEVLTRATPFAIKYINECLYITFKYPNSYWLMKINVK